MKIRHITLTIITILAVIMSACSSSDFIIEAQIDGTPDKAVFVSYVGDNGMVCERIMPGDGNRFTYKGNSDDYTLLWIWDTQGQLIAQMAVRNGDHLTVKSDGLQLPTLDIKGNDVTEQWMKWRKNNQASFDTSDTATIDQLIEQQITQHPDQILSTILLVAEYNQLDGSDKSKQLLQAIRPDMRPQRLVSSLEYLIDTHKQSTGVVTCLTFYRLNKGIEELTLSGKRAALLFWSRSDKNRKVAIDSLRSLARQYGDDITVADIVVDTDTTQWTRTISQDSTTWTHWWAPGGMMDPMLQNITIHRTPLLILSDSTGHIMRVTAL